MKRIFSFPVKIIRKIIGLLGSLGTRLAILTSKSSWFATKNPTKFLVINIRELTAIICVVFSLFTVLTDELDPDDAKLVIGLGTATMAAYFTYARTQVEAPGTFQKENIVRFFILLVIGVAFSLNHFNEEFEVNSEFVGPSIVSILLWLYQRPSKFKPDLPVIP